MAISATAVQPSRSSSHSDSRTKLIFWIILGIAALSIIPFTEIPILVDKTGPNAVYRARLFHDRFLLFPHALCGLTALVTGPLQFSSRIRQKHLRLHRILGRVYVFAVFIAAGVALVLTQGNGVEIATYVQAGAWILCTLAAFLTARNRQIAKHRQWMTRSYAVTFTFVGVRFLDFWPAWANMTNDQFRLAIIIVTVFALFLPDVAFSWHELTTRRA